MALLLKLAAKTNDLFKLRLEDNESRFSVFDFVNGSMNKMRPKDYYCSKLANGIFTLGKNEMKQSLITFAATSVPTISIVFAFQINGLWQLCGGLTVTNDIGIYGYPLRTTFETAPSVFASPSEFRSGTVMIIGINTFKDNVTMTLKIFAENENKEGPYFGEIQWGRNQNDSNIVFGTTLQIANTVPRKYFNFESPAMAQVQNIVNVKSSAQLSLSTNIEPKPKMDHAPMMKMEDIGFNMDELPPLPEWSTTDDEEIEASNVNSMKNETKSKASSYYFANNSTSMR